MYNPKITADKGLQSALITSISVILGLFVDAVIDYFSNQDNLASVIPDNLELYLIPLFTAIIRMAANYRKQKK
jgi:hypothetical protein